jgi:flagellar export protein FliJ
MRRFKYRFEKILVYKSHIEKEKQRALGEMLQKEQAQQSYLDTVHRSRSRAGSEERGFLVGTIDPRRLVRYSRYFLKLKKDDLTGRAVLAHIGKEVTKRRDALLKASQERKIFEKLREKQEARYMEESNRAMNKEYDEISQNTAVRSQ